MKAIHSCSTGSSPRVRGKRGRRHRPLQHRRLIPACAGKTVLCSHRMCPWEAHPRVCGENSLTEISSKLTTGSSPRVRGKPSLSIGNPRGDRLIPACAGKTRGHFPNRYSVRAHPRVCGENRLGLLGRVSIRGSSPRVRGKQPAGRQPPPGLGLIPACAGKTRYGMDSQPLKRAHPRVCGENSFGLLAVAGVVGSSPRVRGKLPPMLRRLLARGLIPACAGKTWNHSQIRCMTRAHPRVCGEN